MNLFGPTRSRIPLLWALCGFWLSLSVGQSASVSAQEIGVLWRGESDIANRTFQAFHTRLKEVAPEFSLEVHKALPDERGYGEVYARYQAEKDAVVSIRSNGTRYIGEHPPSIVTIVGGGNSPKRLGAVQSLEAPEGLVTGTSIAIHNLTRYEVLLAVFPTAKRILVLGEPGHPTTALDREEIPGVCQVLRVTYRVEAVADGASGARLVRELAGQVDLIVLNNTNGMVEPAREIVAAAGMVPVGGTYLRNVEHGAVAAIMPRFAYLGRTMADQLVAIVRDGAPVSSVPVVFDESPQIFLNLKKAAEIGVTVPRQLVDVSIVVE